MDPYKNLHGSHDCILGGGAPICHGIPPTRKIRKTNTSINLKTLKKPAVSKLQKKIFPGSFQKKIWKFMKNQPYLNWLGSIDLGPFWGEGSRISWKKHLSWLRCYHLSYESTTSYDLPYIPQNSWTCHANVSCKLCQFKFIDHLKNVWPNWQYFL